MMATRCPGKNHYYRCRARDFGRDCSQTSVRADIVENQVIHALKTLQPPEDWRKRMIEAMGSLLGDKHLEERITEIKSVIEYSDPLCQDRNLTGFKVDSAPFRIDFRRGAIVERLVEPPLVVEVQVAEQAGPRLALTCSQEVVPI